MTAKRHHYLPQFLLHRFCRDGMLWVYDRESDEIRRQQPINTAVIKDYYSVVTADGEKNTDVETFLSRIESSARPVLEKIDRRESLTAADRDWLSVFIGFLATRVPDFAKTFAELVDHTVKMMTDTMIPTVDRARELMERYERDRPEAPHIEPEKLFAFLQGKEYTATPHRNWTLAAMLQAAIGQAEMFAQMNWFFVRAPAKTSFVLSDTPLSLLAGRARPPAAWMGIGLVTPGTTKVVPLSQHTCLLMGDHGRALGYRDIEGAFVRETNLVTTERADRFVFARDERQLRSLVRASGLAYKQRMPRLRFV